VTTGLFANPRPVEICQLQREDIEFFTSLVADSA
jgi:hypothetical protein